MRLDRLSSDADELEVLNCFHYFSVRLKSKRKNFFHPGKSKREKENFEQLLFVFPFFLFVERFRFGFLKVNPENRKVKSAECIRFNLFI